MLVSGGDKEKCFRSAFVADWALQGSNSGNESDTRWEYCQTKGFAEKNYPKTLTNAGRYGILHAIHNARLSKLWEPY